MSEPEQTAGPYSMGVPFRRPLRLGSRGKDVLAVKRALARWQRVGRLRGMTPLLGPFTVTRLKKFQRKIGLRPTGVYGPQTHKRLLPWFDSYAGRLYGEVPLPPVVLPTALQLPEWFKPTHQTGGLAGYPAVDVFGWPGQPVASPCAGEVVKFSGKDPRLGGKPGSAYGWSMYIERADGRGRYYLTHLASRQVRLGQRIAKGRVIGTICDSAVSGKPGTSHVHEGYHSHEQRGGR